MSARRFAVSFLAVWMIAQSAAEAQLTFRGIGFLPGAELLSTSARALSADGLVVAGNGWSDTGWQAFRWTEMTGFMVLGPLPGGGLGVAEEISADGFAIVGRASSPESDPNPQAFRWTAETGMVALGDLPGGFFSSKAWGVSGDGAVVVGSSLSDIGVEGFRWTAETGIVGLGGLDGPDDESEARAVSADGQVIVGSSGEAFRWTEQDGMMGLGVLPFSDWSRASAVSADGSVVVGRGDEFGGINSQAWRWTAQSGMVGLGDLPGGSFDSSASGVSGDGSIVVGRGCVAGDPIFCSDFVPFIWDAHHGMRNLEEVIEDVYGYDLGGWELGAAADISGDGLTIIGTGGNPVGQSEGWILRLPDCNANGQADDLDILDGISSDENGNVIPDECEPDCNDNGQDDADDIEKGTSDDCNGNNIPDECEADCNANGQPDACDIEQGLSDDCNADHIPDDCDPFPPITEQPLDMEVEAGDVGYFMLTAEGDSLGYQWRHDGVELEDGEHILGSDTSFLILIDVVPGDAGQYDCVITDLITACENTSDPATLTVHGPCPADFDDNGAVGPFDLAILLGAWGPNPKHPADLNADGTVGPPDLALLLGAWGPCP